MNNKSIPLTRLTKKARQALFLLKKSLDDADFVSGANLLSVLSQTKGLASRIITQGKFNSKKLLQAKVNLVELVETAFTQASKLFHPYVGSEHLFLSFLQLTKNKLYQDAVGQVLSLGVYPSVSSPEASPSASGDINTSLLKSFTIDLTHLALADNLPYLYTRQELLDKLYSVLLKKTKNNVLLVGEPGVGKTSLARSLAAQIVSYKVPRPLMGTRMLTFNFNSFVASPIVARNLLGSFSLILQEALADPSILLFIDDLHILASMSAGGYRVMSPLLGMLGDAIGQGLQVIAATTSRNSSLVLESGFPVNKYLQTVEVPEFNRDDLSLYLKEILPFYEQYHHVKVSRDILESLVDLSDRYLPGQAFPGKIVDVLDQASAQVNLNKDTISPKFKVNLEQFQSLTLQGWQAMDDNNLDEALQLRSRRDKVAKKLVYLQTKPRKSWGQVGKLEVLRVLSGVTGVPLSDLNRKEASRYLNIDKQLSAKIVGQEEAVKAVSDSLRRARLRLGRENRPIGNFLFLGPTGVGKTYLAQVVAQILFGKNNFLKLDMSGFRERHTVSRLIGAPPGYVGYEDGGELVDFVNQHPHSVVLFDEVDKCHPEVLNILLQIMEDGVLSDGQGSKADFSHCVVVMTSNFGSDLIDKGKLGFDAAFSDVSHNAYDYDVMKERLLENLRKVLKPEFINRLDQTVVFHRLTPDHLYHICGLEGEKIVSRLAGKGVKLKILPNAKKLLVKWGTSQRYGARPLRRLMEEKIVGPLSEMMLKEEVGEGSSVKAKGVGERLEFEIGS